MISPRKILSAVLVSWLAAPAAMFPQQQEDPRARIRATVELVVVPVTAKDPAGKLVSDIRQDEFRVFEDGREQKITLFSVDPFPLSIVVLIDNALRLKAAEQVGESLRAIAGGFSENDEVAVCRFDTALEIIGDFTKDGDAILSELKRLEINRTYPGEGSGPMTAGPRINAAPPLGSPGRPAVIASAKQSKNIDDAIYAASQMLRDRERGRRRIIYVISDGINSNNNTFSFKDTIKALLSADISVYAIGVGDAVLNRSTGVLSRYAHSTGGDIFYASKRSELEDFYAQITEQARNQYTIGYVPENTDRKIEYHAIEVRVRRAGLSLSTRDGYYTPARP
jgi:VWFA-related protein